MTPGQAAYKEWNELLRPTFLPVLWEKLSEPDRLSWEAVAQAVINQYERNSCVRCGPNDPNPCADGKHWTH